MRIIPYLFLLILLGLGNFSAKGQSYPIGRTVHFNVGSALPNSKGEKELQQIIRLIDSLSVSSLKIYGYASPEGSEDMNEILSQKRAENVHHHILSSINQKDIRIFTTWNGESADGYNLHYDSAHLQQTMVDVLIYPIKKEEP